MALDWQIDTRPLLRLIMITTRADMKLTATHRSLVITISLAILWLLAGAEHLQAQKDPYAEFMAQTNPKTAEEERKSFHVPAGFEVQLVAAEPDVRKPININFDDRGRLWVTESIEYPFPVAANTRPRDSIRILEATNGDGRADKVTTFRDDLNIPIGVLPVTGGAIAYSI